MTENITMEIYEVKVASIDELLIEWNDMITELS